jgi:AcrR family transcriptional regulator
MARTTRRRQALAEAATDYVLDHGLIGLSLRPMAAALGTSDRMLLYHFSDKADLVATVLEVASHRAEQIIRAFQPSSDVRTAVLDLWGWFTSGQLQRCQRVYVQAAALGLLAKQPYMQVVRAGNRRWIEATVDHLLAAGCAPDRARRAVMILDAAIQGFELDLVLDSDEPEVALAAQDLADAIDAFVSYGRAQGSA